MGQLGEKVGECTLAGMTRLTRRPVSHGSEGRGPALFQTAHVVSLISLGRVQGPQADRTHCSKWDRPVVFHPV